MESSSRQNGRRVDSSIQQAKKGVREALKFDSQGKKKNAYLQYLRCVQFIADSLLKDADNTGGRDLSTSNTRKMTKLCQQCVDRAADLLTEIDDSEEIVIDFKRPISEASIPRRESANSTSATEPTSLPVNQSQARIAMFPDVPSTTHQPSSLPSTGALAQPQHRTLPSFYHNQLPSSARRNEPSPTEIAYRKNQQLLAGFKARISRSKNEKHRSMLSLKLQRQLLENMSLARAQEAAITKKMQERHLMLMEEASRRFSSTGEPTADELERRQVYTSVLEYEHQTIWLKSWRAKLKNSPQDLDLINALISKILACQDHPLTRLLQKYQQEILKKVNPLVEKVSDTLCAITVPYDGIDKLDFTDGPKKSRGESFTKLDQTEIVLQEDLSERLSQSPEQLQENATSVHISEDDYFLDEEEMFTEFEEELDDFSISDLSSEASNRLSKDGTKSVSPIAVRNSIGHENSEDKELNNRLSSNDQELTDTFKEDPNGNNTGNKDMCIEQKKDNIGVEENAEAPPSPIGQATETTVEDINNAIGKTDEEEKNLKKSIDSDLEYSSTDVEKTADIPKCEEEEVEASDNEKLMQEDVKEEKNSSDEEKIKKLTDEAYSTHLKAIIKDVHMFIEKMLSMFIAVYEELDSRSARERCTLLIEDPFFQEVWPVLLKLFRVSNHSNERNAAIAMTRYHSALPEHVGVMKKFCLSTEESNNSAASFPYRRAVDELVKLTTYNNPLSKLECIVRTTKNIVRCVEEYYDSIGKPGYRIGNAIGCDDFLPILSYVLVKTASPQIVSECSAMEEFIHEGYLFGEEGYCLTSLQTALGYVLRTLVSL